MCLVEGKMNLKKAAAIFALSVTPAVVIAQDVSNVSVGSLACIDRFGPFNVIGEVLEIDANSNKVRLRDHKGGEDWYDGKKLRNVKTCKIVGEASKWAAHKGVDIMSGN
jgi:hypothetical protein